MPQGVGEKDDGDHIGLVPKIIAVLTSGTFLFPVNPATIETEDGTYEEDIDNGFVWTLGLRYRLDGK